ncbi:FaeA/PapI family transcriptional regulator [Bacillus toyonensis]|uniref:LexA family protein n=1 Tax=Bacillus toyonensis TaxID=155322 RepID=UPI003D25DF30
MLTVREQEVVECITTYMNENGFPPSVRDMAGILFVSHKTAHRYLEQLEHKGCIRRHRHRPRAIQLL